MAIRESWLEKLKDESLERKEKSEIGRAHV